MSLIADALKKADPPLENPPQAELPSPEPSPRPYGIYRGVLIVCVGLVLLGIAQVTRRPPASPAVRSASQIVRTASPAVQSAPAVTLPKGSPPAFPELSKAPGIQLFRTAQAGLALSGTILDNNGESLALINNQVLKEGDRIQDMRVVKVNTDSVELQDQEGRTKTLGLKN